ncbi:MAG: ribonuclease HI [Candidatus Thorarchaeota archaeon]
MKYILFFDGACEPTNPGGIASFGFLLRVNGKDIASGKGVVGNGPGFTNNVAEYEGLINGLQVVEQHCKRNDQVQVKGDSQLVIRQMTGDYQVRSPRMIPLHNRAKQVRNQLRHQGVKVGMMWIPRKQNWRADALSHDAFDDYCLRENLPYVGCDCGGTLVPRKNKKTGHQFLGCSRFPQCRRTAPYPQN